MKCAKAKKEYWAECPKCNLRSPAFPIAYQDGKYPRFGNINCPKCKTTYDPEDTMLDEYKAEANKTCPNSELITTENYVSPHDKAFNYLIENNKDRLIALGWTPPQTQVEPVVLNDEWTPCIKLPVVVHVRKQRVGEKHVSTREGITPVKPDDLIMRGVSGEEYPIGHEIFEKTYSFDIKHSPHLMQPAVAVNEQMYQALVKTKEWFDVEENHDLEPDFYNRCVMCEEAQSLIIKAIAAAENTSNKGNSE